MFWLSSVLVDLVRRVDILPFFRSDHAYVFLRISLPSVPQRVPGVWKLNASLLQDEHYIQMVQDFWRQWGLEKDTLPSVAL